MVPRTVPSIRRLLTAHMPRSAAPVYCSWNASHSSSVRTFSDSTDMAENGATKRVSVSVCLANIGSGVRRGNPTFQSSCQPVASNLHENASSQRATAHTPPLVYTPDPFGNSISTIFTGISFSTGAIGTGSKVFTNTEATVAQVETMGCNCRCSLSKLDWSQRKQEQNHDIEGVCVCAQSALLQQHRNLKRWPHVPPKPTVLGLPPRGPVNGTRGFMDNV